MKRMIPLLFFVFVSNFIFGQKSYLIHLTIDKIVLGNDSVVFKNGKTFLVNVTSNTDTIEVAKPGGVPVGIVVNVRRAKVGEQIRYQIGYSFFKKENLKWVLVRKFPFIDRYELNIPPPGLEKAGTKKAAHEEYKCSIGEPQTFIADFRMDVYKK